MVWDLGSRAHVQHSRWHPSRLNCHSGVVCSLDVRVVAWNCCSGGAHKWGWVEQLEPDVAVICEGPRHSPRPTPTLLDPTVAWHAAGALDHKHVAIGSSGRDLEALEAREGQGQWAIGGRLAEGPDILGIWSCPPNPSKASNASSVTATLTAWADVLAEGRDAGRRRLQRRFSDRP